MRFKFYFNSILIFVVQWSARMSQMCCSRGYDSAWTGPVLPPNRWAVPAEVCDELRRLPDKCQDESSSRVQCPSFTRPGRRFEIMSFDKSAHHRSSFPGVYLCWSGMMCDCIWNLYEIGGKWNTIRPPISEVFRRSFYLIPGWLLSDLVFFSRV